MEEARQALRLQPNLGEAHLSLAYCYYWGQYDYPAALKELGIARKLIPNNAENFMLEAAIRRRQGRFKESLSKFQHALSMDPGNVEAAHSIEATFAYIRDWPAAIRACQQALAVVQRQSPDLVLLERINGAYLAFMQTGKLESIRTVLQESPHGVDPDGIVTIARFELALAERDFPAAERALNECKIDPLPSPAHPISKSEFWGMLQRARGDSVDLVKASFDISIRALELEVIAHPDDATRHALLGKNYAFAGRKNDAVHEGLRAVELTQNQVLGNVQASAVLALIYSQAGDADHAIPLLEHLLTTPGPVNESMVSITLSELRLWWAWDPLRKDPRFQKLISGPEPKTVSR
jgi:serine/threonine-protein kinase